VRLNDVRLTSMVLVIALAAAAHAQVDRGNTQRPPANLDLPRGAFDLRPGAETLQVPPAWRDVERDSAVAFHPAANAVSTRAPATLMVKQLDAFHASERAIEEGHGDPTITMARDPLAELRRRLEEEPAEWMRTEIQVDVGADGALESIAVVASSGRRELDQEALRAVRRAVMRLHPRGKKPATVRFACEAGVVATPPILGTAEGDPRGQGVTAGMRLHFDETTRKVDPLIPLVRRVVTRIHISDYADGN
jgi:TonB family protein